ncbi:Trp repressor protein [compost metagenome]
MVPLLRKGVPYREIYDLTGVSVTTIGRVARSLEHGAGGYAAAIERLAARKTESN